MVRKPRTGGGGSKSPSFDQTLSRNIDSLCKKNNKNYSVIDDLVNDLRSNFSQYSRQKVHPFTKCVARVTDFSNRENDVVSTPNKRKHGKIDPAEEKLQDIEAKYLKRRVSNSGSGSSSVSSGSESSGEEGSSDDDAVYGEEMKPEFDLMKSMLRDNYVKKETGREALEMEVVENNKDSKKVSLTSAGRRKGEDSVVRSRKYDKSSSTTGGESVSSNEPLFKDLGGMRGVIEELMMEVIVPFYHPHLPRKLGVKPTTGILLHGPPGCGKTRLAHAIANETKVPFYKISATELVSGVSGASEENIRELFAKAYRTTPSIVFIDEIDAIASKRENLQREMERRIVTQLMICMDESHKPVKSVADGETENSDSGYVLVIGATNRPDAVDPALRRPGRFDREILLGVPDEKARVEILSVLTRKLTVEGAFDLAKIARATPGFVGADLEALANKAGNLAMKRIIDERKANFSRELLNKETSEDWWRHPWSSEEVENLSISMADFEEAAKLVQPSSRREGFSTIPDVNWDDVGGLHSLRKEFVRYIVGRIKKPEDYEELGINSGTGFLLHGPPGCGKTLIAKAVANEAGANFIHIKGPELLSKYVGESELAVRTIFSRARTCSPCILFFDEVDALTTQRGREGGWVVERLLNQLLVELDGAEKRQGVFIIGATNRIEVMDPALLRPGRFGTRIYVPLPGPDERGLILKTLGRKKPIDPDVDLMAIGKDDACTNFSGADMCALMEKACMLVLGEKQAYTDTSPGKVWTIKEEHFKLSLQEMSPSVSNQQNQSYERTAKRFKDA